MKHRQGFKIRAGGRYTAERYEAKIRQELGYNRNPVQCLTETGPQNPELRGAECAKKGSKITFITLKQNLFFFAGYPPSSNTEQLTAPITSRLHLSIVCTFIDYGCSHYFWGNPQTPKLASHCTFRHAQKRHFL